MIALLLAAMRQSLLMSLGLVNSHPGPHARIYYNSYQTRLQTFVDNGLTPMVNALTSTVTTAPLMNLATTDDGFMLHLLSGTPGTQNGPLVSLELITLALVQLSLCFH